jgi:Domain of unknown function (DUF5753)
VARSGQPSLIVTHEPPLIVSICLSYLACPACDRPIGAVDEGSPAGFHREILSTHEQFHRMVVDLERDASVINHYQSEIVPGFLQTEAYMRALFAAGSLSSEKVDEGG